MSQQVPPRHYSPDGQWVWEAGLGQWRARRYETVITNCRDTVHDRAVAERKMHERGWWLVGQDTEYKVGRAIVKLTFRRWLE